MIAKFPVNFQKEHTIEIAGFLSGGKILDTAALEALSKLLSMDQLRGQFVGLLAGIPRKFRLDGGRTSRFCGCTRSTSAQARRRLNH